MPIPCYFTSRTGSTSSGDREPQRHKQFYSPPSSRDSKQKHQSDLEKLREDCHGLRNRTGKYSSLKSSYGQDQLNKPECKKRISCSSSATNLGYETNEKTKQVSLDETFLRKLLALNRKQELVINKKLADILREEEFGITPNMLKNKSSQDVFIPSSRLTLNLRKINKELPLNMKKIAYKNLPNEPSVASMNTSSKIISRTTKQPQYDMNGRKIYVDSDCTEDEAFIPNLQFLSGKSKAWINTTTVIHTESDMMCEPNETLGAQPLVKQAITITDKEIDFFQSKKGLMPAVSLPERSTKTIFSRKDPEPTGDNFVLRNVGVDPNVFPKQKKRIQKVWNYKDISSIKSTPDSENDSKENPPCQAMGEGYLDNNHNLEPSSEEGQCGKGNFKSKLQAGKLTLFKRDRRAKTLC